MDVERRHEDFTVEADDCDTSDEEDISFPATNVVRDMLRELLTLPDYSTVRIAAEIGISTATIRRLLQGNTSHPSVRTFDKVVRLYCSICQRIYANNAEEII